MKSDHHLSYFIFFDSALEVFLYVIVPYKLIIAFFSGMNCYSSQWYTVIFWTWVT